MRPKLPQKLVQLLDKTAFSDEKTLYRNAVDTSRFQSDTPVEQGVSMTIGAERLLERYGTRIAVAEAWLRGENLSYLEEHVYELVDKITLEAARMRMEMQIPEALQKADELADACDDIMKWAMQRGPKRLIGALEAYRKLRPKKEQNAKDKSSH